MDFSVEGETTARIARTKTWIAAYVIVTLVILVIVLAMRSVFLAAVPGPLILLLDRIRLARERDVMKTEARGVPAHRILRAAKPGRR